MADWQTIGGVAALGFIGGVVTKPLQSWIDELRDRKRLRKILYVEMATLMSRCVLTAQQLRRDPTIGDHWSVYTPGLWPCPCYEHAKTKPEVLNTLDDARGINYFYGGLKAFVDGYTLIVSDSKPSRYMNTLFLHVLRAIKVKVDEGELDKSLLVKHGDERTIQLLEGIPDIGDLIAFHHDRNVRIDSQVPTSSLADSVVKQPLLRFSSVHSFKADDLHHALVTAVENIEHRYPTTAHNVVATVTYTPFRGESLKVVQAPWVYPSPVVNTRPIYSDRVSIGMSESKELILLMYEDPAMLSTDTGAGPTYCLPSFNGFAVEPKNALPYGQWTVTIDLEGDNFVGGFGYKILIGPKPGISITPIKT